jgi:hypothetical protein
MPARVVVVLNEPGFADNTASALRALGEDALALADPMTALELLEGTRVAAEIQPGLCDSKIADARHRQRRRSVILNSRDMRDEPLASAHPKQRWRSKPGVRQLRHENLRRSRIRLSGEALLCREAYEIGRKDGGMCSGYGCGLIASPRGRVCYMIIIHLASYCQQWT